MSIKEINERDKKDNIFEGINLSDSSIFHPSDGNKEIEKSVETSSVMGKKIEKHGKEIKNIQKILQESKRLLENIKNESNNTRTMVNIGYLVLLIMVATLMVGVFMMAFTWKSYTLDNSIGTRRDRIDNLADIYFMIKKEDKKIESNEEFKEFKDCLATFGFVNKCFQD